jgi:hypothetical protein
MYEVRPPQGCAPLLLQVRLQDWNARMLINVPPPPWKHLLQAKAPSLTQ